MVLVPVPGYHVRYIFCLFIHVMEITRALRQDLLLEYYITCIFRPLPSLSVISHAIEVTDTETSLDWIEKAP